MFPNYNLQPQLMCLGILESVFVKQAKIGLCKINKETEEYHIILIFKKTKKSWL